MKKLAQEFVEVIKKNITEQKKSNKTNSYECELETWESRRGGESGYVLSACKKESKLLTRGELSLLCSYIEDLLKELKKAKGWGTLDITFNEVRFNISLYRSEVVKVPQIVRLLAAPCKEFTSLINYIEKYCGKKIQMTDIYNVGIGGKRGRIYGEEGHRHFLAHHPNKCSLLLKELRENRGSKDVVSISNIKTEDYIDEWELQCSIRNEIEFSGARYSFCKVTIKTPKGKEKKTIRISN